jgi:hypothetical protein
LAAVFGGFLTRLTVKASGCKRLSALNATETHAALKTTNNGSVRETDSNTSGVVLAVMARMLSRAILSVSASFASSEIDEGDCCDRPLWLLKAILPPMGSESFGRFEGKLSSLDSSESLPLAFSVLPSTSSLDGSGGVLVRCLSQPRL